jgi:hypothetical protein
MTKSTDLQDKLKLADELDQLREQQVIKKARTNFTNFIEYVIKDETNGSKIKLANLQKTWIKHIGFCINNDIHAMILAPMGAGKCLGPETELLEKTKGNIEAKDVEEGDYILSWDVDRLQSVWKRVKAVEEQRPKDSVEIKTFAGRSLVCTVDHPVMTVNGWKPAGEIDTTDFVVCPLGWEVKNPLNVLDKDLAYSYGMYYAAGNVVDGESILVKGKTSLKRLQRSVDNFNLIVDKTKEHYLIRETKRSELPMHEIFSIRDVPITLQLAETSILETFIAGVFDGCGKFDSRVMSYVFNMDNFEFAACIRDVLQRIGIESFVKTKRNITKKTKSYALVIVKGSISKFYKLPCEQFIMDKSKPPVHEPKTSNVCGDLVTTIIKLPKLETIGIEIEGTHTHVTGGIISHNTQIISVALPLYLMGRNTSNRIKLVCLSDDAAKERLAAVRTYIEEDEDYHRLFPHVKPDPRQEWTRHRLFIERKTKAAKDASFDAKGVLSAGIGGRCNYLLVDDIFDYRTAIAQPATRRQIVETYNQVWLTRLDPGSTAIIICTRWHERDLAGEIINNPVARTRYGLFIQRVAEDFSNIECEALIPAALEDKYQKDVFNQFEEEENGTK